MRDQKRGLVLEWEEGTALVVLSDQLMTKTISTIKRRKMRMRRQTQTRMRWTMILRTKMKKTRKLRTVRIRLLVTAPQMYLESRG